MRSKTAMSLDDVLEVAFYMFVPRGARMSGDETRSVISSDAKDLKVASKLHFLPSARNGCVCCRWCHKICYDVSRNINFVLQYC